MPFYSLIVPVYNRPHEVDELLASLAQQTLTHFEVVVIEDGSTFPCDEVVNHYAHRLECLYARQLNTGPGPARNHGARLAKGDVLIFLDSDVIVPPAYLEAVDKGLALHDYDCFGGPDCAHPDFTPVQKAISYAMTSVLTTGGIRGSGQKMDRFYPRSFNLGIRKGVFDALDGFAAMRFGEDLDLSMRVIEAGHSTGLLSDAWVYHKRRNTFRSFFKQVFNSGIARINLEKRHRGTLKAVHLLPSLFVLGHLAMVLMALCFPPAAWLLTVPALLFFGGALLSTRELQTAWLAVPASYTQLCGYGLGFLKAVWLRVVLGRGEFHSFEKTFYKG
ncbi:cellulose synthase/poly-beta-1,6-N-acetylglucosamine synthase-like glycosyltransferase [Breznakibacter xylanolyticus]|uniref:Cellulose synthase/poly-beta-1,6-N-acetylglucosamine synthase-like glycosyltransferase n=1 Tax=Breznakibacter xylanolyticus TaxID=990 RepID=A0A2W7NUS1_9BACT|nr:glycosyltransferase [Breznakibacter xylanolyticus]PZX20344.1 cellulose synthase/poly-beta-1,6-N-acetylglucosamine synthase-like glycosyltransferase [Breznakibacter xylanolyticus]